MPIQSVKGSSWTSLSSYKGVARASIATVKGVTALIPPQFVERLTGASPWDGSLTNSVTLAKAVSAGNRIVIITLTATGGGPVSVVDSRGNAYTVHIIVGNDGTATQRVGVCSAHVSTALQIGDTITVTWDSTTVQQKVMIPCVLSNCAASGQPDITKARTVYASSVSEAATTTATNTVAIGIVSLTVNTATYGSSSWSIAGGSFDSGGSRRGYIVYSNFTSAGSKNPGGAWTTTQGQANAWVAFK